MGPPITSFVALGVLVLAIAAFAWARGRAAGYAADGARLHSRPGYHGGALALAAAGPAALVLILYGVIGDTLANALTVNAFRDAIGALERAEGQVFIRDARAIAEGRTDFAAQLDETRRAAAAYLRRIDFQLSLGVSALAALLAAWGLWRGALRVSPEDAARNRVERVVRAALAGCAGLAILVTVGIVASLLFESLRFFSLVSPLEFFFSLDWDPQTSTREDQVGAAGRFGVLPLLYGTFFITAIALAVAAPVGIYAAIFLSEYAGPRARSVVKPMLELLAGIPTVVYGFFAAFTLGPLVRDAGAFAGLAVPAQTALAAGVVMGIMIIPFVSSLSDDVINATPQSLRDGSYAMGATTSETVRFVLLPAALPGLAGALLLAVSRAAGETMIVVMAAGLADNITVNPLDSVTTITVQIVNLLAGDQAFDTAKSLSAFALGLTLFIITLITNFIALHIVRRYREQYE